MTLCSMQCTLLASFGIEHQEENLGIASRAHSGAPVGRLLSPSYTTFEALAVAAQLIPREKACQNSRHAAGKL